MRLASKLAAAVSASLALAGGTDAAAQTTGAVPAGADHAVDVAEGLPAKGSAASVPPTPTSAERPAARADAGDAAPAPLVAATNDVVIVQVIGQLQRGCQRYCYGTTQSQVADQAATVRQTATADATGARNAPRPTPGAETSGEKPQSDGSAPSPGNSSQSTAPGSSPETKAVPPPGDGSSPGTSASPGAQHASPSAGGGPPATATGSPPDATEPPGRALAVNRSRTVQALWQLQIGCRAFCFGTALSQIGNQSSDTRQTATASADGGAAASNVARAVQLAWQRQLGCEEHCFEVRETQSLMQRQATNQTATAHAPQGPGAIDDVDPREGILAWARSIGSIVQLIWQEQFADCMEHCGDESQLQVADQRAASRQRAVASHGGAAGAPPPTVPRGTAEAREVTDSPASDASSRRPTRDPSPQASDGPAAGGGRSGPSTAPIGSGGHAVAQGAPQGKHPRRQRRRSEPREGAHQTVPVIAAASPGQIAYEGDWATTGAAQVGPAGRSAAGERRPGEPERSRSLRPASLQRADRLPGLGAGFERVAGSDSLSQLQLGLARLARRRGPIDGLFRPRTEAGRLAGAGIGAVVRSKSGGGMAVITQMGWLLLGLGVAALCLSGWLLVRGARRSVVAASPHFVAAGRLAGLGRFRGRLQALSVAASPLGGDRVRLLVADDERRSPLWVELDGLDTLTYQPTTATGETEPGGAGVPARRADGPTSVDRPAAQNSVAASPGAGGPIERAARAFGYLFVEAAARERLEGTGGQLAAAGLDLVLELRTVREGGAAASGGREALAGALCQPLAFPGADRLEPRQSVGAGRRGRVEGGFEADEPSVMGGEPRGDRRELGG